MKRSELEHLIRAAGSIANDAEIVVIGSQSILAQFPDAPASLLVSAEADLFPMNNPQLSDLIDGSIGEGSPFHELFGYYAQGVDDKTATLPGGWRKRLVKIRNPNTVGVTGLCLEVHDLAISKYVAGREKDREFTKELVKHQMIQHSTLLSRERATEVPAQVRELVKARIERDFQDAKKAGGTKASAKDAGATITEAIGRRSLLQFRYGNHVRVVAPYCFGVSTRGEDVLRAVQIRGASSSNAMGFGKLWTVSKILDLRMLNETFTPDDPDYNPNDKGMKQIYSRIESAPSSK
jgi:hypothetical protein